MKPTTKRVRVRAELAKSLCMIIHTIREVFNKGPRLPSQIQAQTMKCLQVWVQFDIANNVTEELFPKLIRNQKDEGPCDCSPGARGAIVSHLNPHKYSNTMKKTHSNAVKLQEEPEHALEEDEGLDVRGVPLTGDVRPGQAMPSTREVTTGLGKSSTLARPTSRPTCGAWSAPEYRPAATCSGHRRAQYDPT